MSVGDNTIAAYAAQLMDLEDMLDQAQGDKKQFFEGAREAHGGDFVKSLKIAVKLERMPAGQREKNEAIDTEAERIRNVIRQGLVRGARTREGADE